VTRPSFILFNPDEWRADCAGCYGHPVVETPNLDRLAAEGVRFDQCHTQHPVCSPSRAAFMTGWYPHVRGHRTLWHLLRPDEPNLLRYLTEAGYDVRWYGKNDLLSQESIAASATEASALSGEHFGPNPWPREDPRYFSFLYGPGGDPRAHVDYRRVEAGLRFLRGAHERPFCLYLPIGMPHCPYSAPAGFHDRYDPEALPPPRPPAEGKPSFHARIRATRRLDELDERVFRQIGAVYLGMISYADFLLGELLRALDETGLAESTVVIAFSDHGDWAGDYGLVEKWPSALDDAITRVPFVVRAPGGARGHVVPQLTELFDLAPTVLALAGVEPRHTMLARSLARQIGGEPGDPTRAAFAEGGYDPHEVHCFEGHPGGDQIGRDPGHIYYPKARLQQDEPLTVCRAATVRTATHRLVRRPLERSELYDLRRDPDEMLNLHGRADCAEVERELERRLLDWYVHTADVTPLDEDPRGFGRAWMGSAHAGD
jgi:arylsulfatase A-like enzyme